MNFNHYPAERLLIDNIIANLTMEERFVRCKIMDMVITQGNPVAVDGLKSLPELNNFNVERIVASLIEKRKIVLDEQRQIIFVYPVSALPTNHKVTLLDGRTLSAMCAIDAMGVASTIKQDTVVESKCSMCGTPITVKITDGNIVAVDPADTHVLHVDLNRIENWAGSC